MTKCRTLVMLCLALGASAPGIQAQGTAGTHTAVFFEQGFPIVDSEAVSRAALSSALGPDAVFETTERMQSSSGLENVSLVVLPYGSAFPAELWPALQRFLRRGGNLLLLGGQPLRVPVGRGLSGSFQRSQPQDTYSRALGFQHSYAVPLTGSPLRFEWRKGYEFLPKIKLAPLAVYAQEGRLNGLGYLDAADGTHAAAAAIVADAVPGAEGSASRVVALPFRPQPGFWESADGVALVRAAAQYAAAGATNLLVETQYVALRPGELPELSVHLRHAGSTAVKGTVQVELRSGSAVLDHTRVEVASGEPVSLPFRKPLASGVYTVSATWTPEGQKAPQEAAENGFVVEELSTLQDGPKLAVQGDFLSLGGKPFWPVGTNYFTTEENGWDFSGPRNGAVWERDFADMERHGVSFVRTGVWMNNGKFIEPITGDVNERFLRNLEGYLAAAQRHNIAVNFTFFAFTPSVGQPRRPATGSGPEPAPPNPYLDPGTLRGEQQYVDSVVHRFGQVPWLSYDLINEPSFSNPRVVFHGNVPNGDPAEVSAWHTWLEKRYRSIGTLAEAWRVTPEELIGFDRIALPRASDLSYGRYGNAQEVRAFDYNLFAQEMFADWVKKMVGAIRDAGSEQLVNVGQDEGGVTNRLLNQFYATAGVAFTTNHTYWSDDALLWDSVAAKRPGMPNITGETGYQPAWNADGTWRYDELTGSAIEERKWALGFAAGSSGALQWDWARETDFGIQRSDGSAKVWEAMMQGMGDFARKAAPFATGMRLPDIAVILPQTLQLSVFNQEALEAQQNAIRVLYQRNRVEAYAVGEYQTDTLGTPKLIILPSAYGLSDKAWRDLEDRVRAGAVLLISGPFSGDEHLHPTDRGKDVGLQVATAPLQLRHEALRTPFGQFLLEYPGLKTTALDHAVLAGGGDWAEVPLGRGKVLFSGFPLELNSNADSIAAVYAHAIAEAGVERTYATDVKDAGILICPTRLPHATLYVLSSETETTPVSFEDKRSRRRISGRLQAGRAALLLVGEDGKLLTSYGWQGAAESR